MKRYILTALCCALLLCGFTQVPATPSKSIPAASIQEIAASAPIALPPFDPVGTYYDHMDSELSIRKGESGEYRVDYGIYHLTWIEDVPGYYDPELNVLTFAGEDASGPLSAMVYAVDDHLMVTLTKSPYDLSCPPGTSFAFYGKEQIHPEVEEAAAMKQAYYKALLDLYNTQTLPGGIECGSFDLETLEKNKFAVFDVDGDSREELMINYTETYMAGMTCVVFDYDAASGELRSQLWEFPALEIYDNGMVMAGWSHNQGLAGDSIWPYNLYRYDALKDTYVMVAMVDGWDSSLSDRQYDGTLFPKEADEDGDGILYYAMTKGYEFTDPMDGAEYEAWKDSFLMDASPIIVPFEKLTMANISAVTAAG